MTVGGFSLCDRVVTMTTSAVPLLGRLLTLVVDTLRVTALPAEKDVS